MSHVLLRIIDVLGYILVAETYILSEIIADFSQYSEQLCDTIKQATIIFFHIRFSIHNLYIIQCYCISLIQLGKRVLFYVFVHWHVCLHWGLFSSTSVSSFTVIISFSATVYTLYGWKVSFVLRICTPTPLSSLWFILIRFR